MGTSPSVPRMVTRDATICGSVSNISLKQQHSSREHQQQGSKGHSAATLSTKWHKAGCYVIEQSALCGLLPLRSLSDVAAA